MGLFWSNGRNKSQEYLHPDRLEDVLALIQILGLDVIAHRGAKALATELQGPPKSLKNGTWVEIASAHPEFFRVYNGRNEPSASLVVRHVMPKENGKRKSLDSEAVNGLIQAAISLHNGQLQRRQILTAAWFAGLLALLPVFASLASAVTSLANFFRAP